MKVWSMFQSYRKTFLYYIKEQNLIRSFWDLFVEERKRNNRSFSQERGTERVPFLGKERGKERVPKIWETAKALFPSDDCKYLANGI